MDNKFPKLEETGRKSPFKVPENYFEQLNKQIVDRLDETTIEQPKTVNLWARVRPWMYAAALVAGLALMFNLFSDKFGNQEIQYANNTSKVEQLTSLNDEDYDEIYEYLEAQAILLNYRDAFFIDEY